MLQDRAAGALRSDLVSFADAEPALPDLPQWRSAAGRLSDEGWEQFGDYLTIAGSAMTSDIWTTQVPLAHYDRGYDYLALVGVRIKDASPSAAFIAPNILGNGRRLQAVAWDDARRDYVLLLKQMNETPRISSVERTDPAALPNNEDPAGVTLAGDCPFLTALAILPPPAIQRDLTLSNLLTRQVNADLQWWWYDCASHPDIPAPDDQDWSVAAELTVAQIAMLETALVRTVGSDHICDPAYIDTRKLLALPLRQIDSSLPGFLQHPAIGFRGIQNLSWQYRPLHAMPPGSISDDTAEATRFRIYQVRVETDPDQAGALATAHGMAGLSDLGDHKYECRLTPESGQVYISGIENVVCDRRPALIRIDPASSTDGSEAWYGNVTGVRRVTPASACASEMPMITAVSLEVEMEDRPSGIPPGSLGALIFVGQPLSSVDRQIEDHSQSVVEESIALPIGGGPPERFAWWIGTISAQTKESGLSRCAFLMRQMPGTIEPASPVEVRLAAPTKPQHVLDPGIASEKIWLPQTLRENPSLVGITPHTVLTWRAYPFDPIAPVGMIINRAVRRIVPPAADGLRNLSNDVWLVIKQIESATESTKLEPAWVDQVRQGWLLGDPVDHPDADVQESALDPFIPAAPAGSDGFLDGSRGIKLVEPPATDVGTQPGFIDYSRDNSRLAPMTVDYEYQYEIQPYIDLGGGNYLKGRAVLVSHWQRPENIRIVITPQPGTDSTVPWSDGPFVRFTISQSLTSLKRLQQVNDPTSWRVPDHHPKASSLLTAADGEGYDRAGLGRRWQPGLDVAGDR